MAVSSRLPGFYNQSLTDRLQTVREGPGLPPDGVAALSGASGLTAEGADHMIENALGVFGLPIGIAANFRINGRDVLIPMAIEEPSVVAGASFAARLARDSGGFTTSSDTPIMIAQVQVLDLINPHAARLALLANKQRLLDFANTTDPVIVGLGGGARDIEARIIEDTPVGPMLIVHLLYACLDPG